MSARRFYQRLSDLEARAIALSRPIKPALPDWLCADFIQQGLSVSENGTVDWAAWKVASRAEARMDPQGQQQC